VGELRATSLDGISGALLGGVKVLRGKGVGESELGVEVAEGSLREPDGVLAGRVVGAGVVANGLVPEHAGGHPSARLLGAFAIAIVVVAAHPLSLVGRVLGPVLGLALKVLRAVIDAILIALILILSKAHKAVLRADSANGGGDAVDHHREVKARGAGVLNPAGDRVGASVEAPEDGTGDTSGVLVPADGLVALHNVGKGLNDGIRGAEDLHGDVTTRVVLLGKVVVDGITANNSLEGALKLGDSIVHAVLIGDISALGGVVVRLTGIDEDGLTGGAVDGSGTEVLGVSGHVY